MNDDDDDDYDDDDDDDDELYSRWVAILKYLSKTCLPAHNHCNRQNLAWNELVYLNQS